MIVYLHIGTHKTGTTAIQSAMAANQAALAKLGVLYPAAGRPEEAPIAVGHHLLPWSLTDPERDLSAWEELRAELEDSKLDLAVVSAEDFTAVREPRQLTWIRDLLGDHEVRVIAYLRRQDEFLHGAYSTRVLYNGDTRELDDGAGYIPGFQRALLGRWEKAFGHEALTVRVYEREQLAGRDVIRDFAEAIGIELPRGFKRPSASINRSYPRNLVECARRLVLHGASVEELQPVRALAEAVYRGAETEPDALSPQERRELLRTCAVNNAYIARHYLGRADGRLFSDAGFGDERAWQARYGGHEAELRASIRDLRDAFRRAREPGAADQPETRQ